MQTFVDSETILTLDLGGTKLLGIIMNRSAEIILRRQYSSPKGNEAVRDTIIDLLADMLASANALKIQPSGIAICAPGFIDTQNGVIIDAENLQIQKLSLTQPIISRFNLSTRLFHDVKCATLGEALFGAGRGRRYFAFLNIGTGVSVGLYLDGKVYQGAAGKAGEIGHVALRPVGPANPCGLEERLEMLVSGPALAGRAAKLLAQTSASLIHELAAQNAGQVTTQIIHEAALRGDGLAVQLIAETADYLGLVVGGISDVLDLECVILGGGVAQMGDLLLAPLQASVARYAIEAAPIFASTLGGDVGAIGAAASYFCLGE